MEELKKEIIELFSKEVKFLNLESVISDKNFLELKLNSIIEKIIEDLKLHKSNLIIQDDKKIYFDDFNINNSIAKQKVPTQTTIPNSFISELTI